MSANDVYVMDIVRPDHSTLLIWANIFNISIEINVNVG